MGMRIGNTGASQSSAISNWQQRQQSVKDMFSALKSGDLSSAQKAFAAMGTGNSSATGDGPFAQIGKALQSGDLAGAQKAAQDFQAKRAGGHHHHHDGSQASAQTSTAAAPSTITSGPGSLLNIVA